MQEKPADFCLLFTVRKLNQAHEAIFQVSKNVICLSPKDKIN